MYPFVTILDLYLLVWLDSSLILNTHLVPIGFLPCFKIESFLINFHDPLLRKLFISAVADCFHNSLSGPFSACFIVLGVP